MLDPSHVPSVSSDELLARYVLFSRHFRSSDNTVKPDAFMPHPRVELSMTRHVQASEEELWKEGDRIAALRNATLYGRADVGAKVFTDQGLTVMEAPIIPENPNHANAVGWPDEKSAQKLKALEVAEKAVYLPKPI